jgi:hypothetical protein
MNNYTNGWAGADFSAGENDWLPGQTMTVGETGGLPLIPAHFGIIAMNGNTVTLDHTSNGDWYNPELPPGIDETEDTQAVPAEAND